LNFAIFVLQEIVVEQLRAPLLALVGFRLRGGA
jgi:hypothetical protein